MGPAMVTLTLAVAAAGGGCVGAIGEGPGGEGPGDGSSALCAAPGQRGLAEVSQRRLSRRELLATLDAAFGAEVMDHPAVAATLTYLPKEAPFGDNNAFDDRITDVEGLLSVAEAVAGVVVSDPELAQSVLECDLADAPACQERVLDTLAPRLLRRPMADAQRQSFAAFMGGLGGMDGLEWGVVRLLVSPELQLLLELDGSDTADGRVRLAPIEVAARLSFRLTGGPPDDELRRSALEGELETLAAVRAQATRLLATPQARAELEVVLAGWLGLASVPDPDPAIAAQAGIDAEGLGAEARSELFAFVDDLAFSRAGTLQDLLTDKTAFATTDRLAALYGVPRSDAPARFGDARGGILLRAATLMTGHRYTAPISRGAYMRKKILCQQLVPPDPSVVAERDEQAKALTHELYSTRTIVEELTRGQPCEGCHLAINPIGFTLEGFGPMGELRERELVFAADGSVVGEHDVVTAVDDLGLGSGPTPAAGPSELVAAVAADPAVAGCFAEQLFAHTRLRRAEDEDACAVAEIEAALAEGLPLVEALIRNVANEDIFYRRPFGDEAP
jgi:hypothetical protein